MAASITCTPTSPYADKSVCRVDVAGASTNRADHSEFRYYLSFESGTKGLSYQLGKSYVFNVSSSGAHQFFDYIFPSAGTWYVELRDVVGDGEVATLTVTVQ